MTLLGDHDADAARGDRAVCSRSSTGSESPSVPSEGCSSYEKPAACVAPAVRRVRNPPRVSSTNVSASQFYTPQILRPAGPRTAPCIVSHVEDDVSHEFTYRDLCTVVFNFPGTG